MSYILLANPLNKNTKLITIMRSVGRVRVLLITKTPFM